MSRRTHYLNRQIEEEKENFIYLLYLENCDERRQYKDAPYTFAKYIDNNREFIEDKWSEYLNEIS